MGGLTSIPSRQRFFEERAKREATTEFADAFGTAIGVYRARREWDAAFELLDRLGLEGLESLIGEALDDLLNSARLATLDAWVTRAMQRGLDFPILLVARAELDLRHGLHTSAEATARRAADRSMGVRDVEYRALEVAGRAAHTGSREEEALDLYRRAGVVAPDANRWRRAMWGQVMCAAALELPEAHGLLKQLEEVSARHEPAEMVRLVDRQLAMGYRFGYVRHLNDARRVAELVPLIEDPFSRCSFRSVYGWALALGSFYAEAREQAQYLLEEATEYRVDVALPYAQAILGYSLAGLRQFEEAQEALLSARLSSRAMNDPFGDQQRLCIDDPCDASRGPCRRSLRSGAARAHGVNQKRAWRGSCFARVSFGHAWTSGRGDRGGNVGRIVDARR